ncbi:MAG: methylenetetrahydrofolate--tRNA-(uracil(54)-C(5))-methyltransferase (FADH(2)-oxidizing) TrmFO [Clostridia bacterium]|nr:methylenetetrahydrofolate--tRNA-(uracil(54)-C(5))-methyltransferase (FADH(2)-oxidizing) TrmFO [Clostridia bacterium]
MKKVRVIGAGLAGCEAAWQLAIRGIQVELWEMKPEKMTPAHKSENFAELVCSNSLRGDALSNAVGLLKEELRRKNSLILSCADATRVPAGGALAVDREQFSALVTKKIKECENIEIKYGEVLNLSDDLPTIVATGPLTTDGLAEEIRHILGENYLSFYDAAAPIVSFDSIDMESAYFKSRYDKGSADYINAPMSREEYEIFWNELCNAEEAAVHGFEDKKVFEGCMPVEVMGRRGHDTLLFGPLKPVGLEDPKTGKEPYAVVQLRKDNAAGTLYNLVGFQTHLKFPEQKRVFSLIPALKNAEFVRYGVMHRNTYMNAPLVLNDDFSCKKRENLYFAGQMTGVEGYVESTASGFVAGVSLARKLLDLPKVDFPQETALGALGKYIANADPDNFQPMNINYGLLPPLGYRVKGKKFKNEELAKRALYCLDKIEC